jgi:hypothetical protein
MPSLVQYAVSEPGSGVSSPQTVSFSSTTAGNLIVVVAGDGTGVTLNVPSDGVNTYTACAGASTFSSGLGTQLVMYYAPSIAGGAVTISSSWTGTAGYYCVYAFELSGVNSYDNGAGNSQSTNGNASTGNFTTSYSNEIIIAATFNGSDAIGAVSPYTLIEITNNYNDALMYASPVAAGTQDAQATMDGVTQTWSIVAGAFYQSSPPPATTSGMVISAAGW